MTEPAAASMPSDAARFENAMIRRANRFAYVNVGEDNAFVWSRCPKRLVVNSQDDQFVATIHRGNISPRDTANQRWRAVRTEQIKACLRA